MSCPSDFHLPKGGLEFKTKGVKKFHNNLKRRLFWKVAFLAISKGTFCPLPMSNVFYEKLYGVGRGKVMEYV